MPPSAIFSRTRGGGRPGSIALDRLEDPMPDDARRDDRRPAPGAAQPAPASRAQGPPDVAAGLDRFGSGEFTRHAGLGRWIALNARLRDRDRTGPPAACPRRPRAFRPDVEGHAVPA